MNVPVRDGKFDLVVVAGPRLETWPSIGVRTLSSLCAEMGLSVGLFGGEDIIVRGVIPLPGTGGLVLAEDIQKRIHRIHARSIVKISCDSSLPDPFPGWRSQGLIPLSTAERLLKESKIQWDPCTVVLGSGNRALRFASSLLHQGVPEVFCVESFAQWGAKRFSGWEVERRRFEMAGGKLIEAKPVQLSSLTPLVWQLRLQDTQGIRVLNVGRVVSAGPFQNRQQLREYPKGSLLFELDQTAPQNERDHVEGWTLEIERSRWLAGKIVKALGNQSGAEREALDAIFKRARGRLKRYLKHREEPFTPNYQGKWIHATDSKAIRSFSGVPQSLHHKQPVASIECFEEIPCHLCQSICPTSAIQTGKVPRTLPILTESACTACGLCISICPSNTITMLKEREQSTSPLTVVWTGQKPWQSGEFVTLVNRRGEALGSARIAKVSEQTAPTAHQQVELDVPSHLLWDARGIKRGRQPASEDKAFLTSVDRSSSSAEKVEITLNGEKRLVRDRIPLTVALFEIGHGRPEDILFCPDKSCGLCQVTVDGVKKFACDTKIHKGISLKLSEKIDKTETTPAPANDRTNEKSTERTPEQKEELSSARQAEQPLCACLNITKQQVVERLRQGQLQSPEAVLSVTKVGEGKCHGGLCMETFKRTLQEEGLNMDQWIDWRFPWSDWNLTHS